jgi:hypothetical protein
VATEIEKRDPAETRFWLRSGVFPLTLETHIFPLTVFRRGTRLSDHQLQKRGGPSQYQCFSLCTERRTESCVSMARSARSRAGPVRPIRGCRPVEHAGGHRSRMSHGSRPPTVAQYSLDVLAAETIVSCLTPQWMGRMARIRSPQPVTASVIHRRFTLDRSLQCSYSIMYG